MKPVWIHAVCIMGFVFITLLIYVTAFLQLMSKLIIFMLKKRPGG